MYRVLCIQEILSNIFGHCAPTETYWTEDRRRSTAVLAALARTCRAFKEPALDVLWSELVDLTPLARCIPEACSANRQTGFRGKFTRIRYSFKRQPNEAEWDILRSYTRRIWHIYGDSNSDRWLDDASLTRICNPPISNPLFPKIRTLWWEGMTLIPAAHIAVPSLTSLSLHLTPGPDSNVSSSALNDFLDTVVTLCPNIEKFHFHIFPTPTSNEIVCRHIRRQTNLREIYCHGINFDVDTFSHLSRMPSFTRLAYLPYGSFRNFPVGILSSGPISVFQALTCMKVHLPPLQQITEFLSYTRLLGVEHLEVNFSSHLSKETFRSFFATVQSVCSADSLTGVDIICENTSSTSFITDVEPDPRLTLDDVRPCKAFVNVRHVHINIHWSVDMTDSDLVALVSAWPHLCVLLINDLSGWRTTRGITLQGLLQLLQMRRSLSELCIAIRTNSYTELPRGYETGFLPPPTPLVINFADSIIQKADVQALVDVFVKLRLPIASFSAWEGKHMRNIAGLMDCMLAWKQVFDGVEERFSSESDGGARFGDRYGQRGSVARPEYSVLSTWCGTQCHRS